MLTRDVGEGFLDVVGRAEIQGAVPSRCVSSHCRCPSSGEGTSSSACLALSSVRLTPAAEAAQALGLFFGWQTAFEGERGLQRRQEC